jgi:uncharacterized protein (TIGR02246 family)
MTDRSVSTPQLRPTLELGAGPSTDARKAVLALVGELQRGWDLHDADLSNRHFADDIVWGSPFGATVRGYEELHAVHVRLKQQARGGPSSRFEVVDVLAPTPEVVITQVRRVALDPTGAPIDPSNALTGSFSEMALYVLVHRDGTWWLAAGQNTPIRPPPAA